MADWTELAEELGRWRASGRVPTMWLRDDDARAPGPKLDHLIAMAARHALPLHLAVVPHGLDPALADRLRRAGDVWVLQHGFAHLNHAPPGGPASEFTAWRPLEPQLDDLKAGWRTLEAAGLPRLLPGLVPPWNHVSDATVRALPSLGYRILSRCFARSAAASVPGLLQVNIHVDPIRWKEGPQFRGTAATLAGIVEHMAARRVGAVDSTEPTGVLSHHAQTDAATWAFLDRLFGRLAGQVKWVRLEEMLRDG